MIYSKPLAYDSLKSVLLRMEANFRINLSLRIPGIRTAEKSMPLYVEFLQMTPNGTDINSLEYMVHCVQPNPLILSDWQEDIVPEEVKTGFGSDLTRFGIRDFSVDDEILPGDVVLPEAEIVNMGRRMLELNLQELDEMMTLRMDDLTESPGTHLVFKILNSSRLVSMEHLDYSRSLAQAAKYMNEKLLGGRRRAIRVERFHDGYGVLRLPVGLTLKTKESSIRRSIEELCDSYQGILLDESFPQKCIAFIGDSDDFIFHEVYQHPHAQSAGHLQFECKEPNENWLDAILGVKNSEGHFECGIHHEVIFSALDFWIGNGWEIGRDWSFGIEKEEDVRKLLDACQAWRGLMVDQIPNLGCITFPDVFTIPLKNATEMSIYCKDNYGRKYFEEYCRWELNIVVTSKDHRHLWNVDFDKDVVLL